MVMVLAPEVLCPGEDTTNRKVRDGKGENLRARERKNQKQRRGGWQVKEEDLEQSAEQKPTE